MTLQEFCTMQGLTPDQGLILEDMADTMTENKIIAAPDQLYKALAADQAVLSVKDAAKVLGVSEHYIRRLGKAGKIRVDGSRKVHRIRYSSLLKYMRSEK